MNLFSDQTWRESWKGNARDDSKSFCWRSEEMEPLILTATLLLLLYLCVIVVCLPTLVKTVVLSLVSVSLIQNNASVVVYIC